ncbi:hypothetical protein EVAR_94137_1 [Eumeta japonica]|uniref:Uncharacterized protein n=1 Tax=Eumeta variegata TaxID=151549 RepID=A0A4C1U748_EUMVA|nr:hypothetical protein EVAR_94137_1 [Eumeta japonica]
MRRAQARQSYIYRYVVILLRVYWRKVMQLGERRALIVDHTGHGWHEAARLVYDFARLPRIGEVHQTLQSPRRPTADPEDTTPARAYAVDRREGRDLGVAASENRASRIQ